ncbi:sigma-70 family RNA polymerase sigma factor [Alicyclobacillus fastidiosus]|uniref:Sigma-70 family RNA polymerase sigma factor n=1 Tax=Alicyclobacillus fastidiosus TaxID=392011 RepID=A0ABV5AL32_9BACL|nr:sigma-70 family RNA polymerase sigma factor [Alicyclobacillus fastidiosus]WEH11972.1 sigma-70 family RNA polymerase sigma factor [Alicyclobacillus fastidiosus]
MPYQAYQTWGRQQESERIEAHLPLVYSLASNLAPRAGALGLEMGDLVHTGVLGLYSASTTFQESRGSTFGAYAKPFVRGAMLDEIARHKNEPRAVRDKYRKIRDAEEKLVRLLMREPTTKELADAVGIEVKTLSDWLTDIGMRDRASLEELAERGTLQDQDHTTARQPELSFLDRESKQQLVAALGLLPQREQQLLYLYYQEELTLKEIGYVLDLSESQVSRTHKKALARLQEFLAEAE